MMKFSLNFFATIISISVLFFVITPTNACEQECRTGISLAFGDNYAIEVGKLFEIFKTDLQNNIFKGFKGHVSSSARSDINGEISDQVDIFEKGFTGNFAKLIEDSIFNQSPQFKGQCQHPLRVLQPPAGVAWTMEDCENQDYICGNPPAICHYMDQYVKPRNVKNVKESLEGRLDISGNFFSTLVKSILIKAIGSNIKITDIPSFATNAENNIINEFKTFSEYFDEEFCKGTTCDKYDHDIKIKLLSYP